MEKYKVWDQAKLEILHCRLKGCWSNEVKYVINFYYLQLHCDQHCTILIFFHLGFSPFRFCKQLYRHCSMGIGATDCKTKSLVSSISSQTTFQYHNIISNNISVSLISSPTPFQYHPYRLKKLFTITDIISNNTSES